MQWQKTVEILGFRPGSVIHHTPAGLMEIVFFYVEIQLVYLRELDVVLLAPLTAHVLVELGGRVGEEEGVGAARLAGLP